MPEWKPNTEVPDLGFPKTSPGQQNYAALAVLGTRDDGTPYWRFYGGIVLTMAGATIDERLEAMGAVEQAALVAGVNPTTDEMVWIQGDTAVQLEPGLDALNARLHDQTTTKG